MLSKVERPSPYEFSTSSGVCGVWGRGDKGAIQNGLDKATLDGCVTCTTHLFRRPCYEINVFERNTPRLSQSQMENGKCGTRLFENFSKRNFVVNF
ncbi:unnamed protein product [Pieris macdunnoughi]|uniref:Uncharacterized protein n=1 Tax=Pieris macdunnoughi TaxID=345717 RepID=A0A821QK89_9NEOP|nr:unnamed protein product [Pieris macdunnoughi]